MKLLYFTATGNNLHVAKELGGELLSIPQMIKEGRYEFTDDKIGMIFPIYSNQVIPYIKEFVEKAKFNCDYLFGIMTYGAYDAASANHLVEIGKSVGHDFAYVNTLKMVDNWLPGFDMDKQVASEHKKKIPEKLASIKADIEASKRYVKPSSLLGRTMTNYQVKQTSNPKVKPSMHSLAHAEGVRDFVTVESNCTKCGTCARVCPVDNITVDKENGVSYGDYCVMCFACLHNCPHNAIRLKGERSKARYRNRHVSLKEIIQANK